MRQVVFDKFYLFSVFKNDLTTNVNHARTMEVRSFLDANKVNFALVSGRFNGHKEASFLVFDSEGVEDTIKSICSDFNQLCYIVRDKDNSGYQVDLKNDCKIYIGIPKELQRNELSVITNYTSLPQVDGTKKYFTFIKEQ